MRENKLISSRFLRNMFNQSQNKDDESKIYKNKKNYNNICAKKPSHQLEYPKQV